MPLVDIFHFIELVTNSEPPLSPAYRWKYAPSVNYDSASVIIDSRMEDPSEPGKYTLLGTKSLK